jgi:hypothetical protein
MTPFYVALLIGCSNKMQDFVGVYDRSVPLEREDSGLVTNLRADDPVVLDARFLRKLQ